MLMIETFSSDIKPSFPIFVGSSDISTIKMSETLCLQWNDFQKNVANAFKNLREDKDFADMTLVCEDGNQIEVHKVVLSSSSPFFKTLLAKNKHPHPLIYMRGIKSGDLSAVVDFLYHGEAKVFDEDLDSFLAIAEEFQLMGLMKEPDEKVLEEKVDQNDQSSKRKKTSQVPIEQTSSGNLPSPKPETERKVIVPNDFSSDLDELEARVMYIMQKSENRLSDTYQNRRTYICNECGKQGFVAAIKDHIESNHLEGIRLPCTHCGKIFRLFICTVSQENDILIDENVKSKSTFNLYNVFFRTRTAARIHRSQNHK